MIRLLLDYKYIITYKMTEYAYIQYLNGNKLENRAKIHVSEISYNFKKKPFNKSKSYILKDKSDGVEYKIAVIYMADSMKSLDAQIAKGRSKVAPMSKMSTASDLSSGDEPLAKRFKTVDSVKKNEDRVKKYAKILNIKVEKLDEIIERKKHQGEANNLDNADDSFLNESEVEGKGSKSLKAPDSVVTVQTNNHDDISVSKEVENNKENIDNNITAVAEQDDVQESTNTSPNKENNKIPDIHGSTESEPKKKDELPLRSKPKITKDIKVHSTQDCREDIQKLKKTIETHEKTLKERKKENEKLKKKNKKLSEEIEKIQATANQYQDLNIKLQTLIIDRAETQQDLQQQLADTTDEIEMKFNKNFNKIGYLRKSDQKVHIGRNVWIDEKVYNGVLNKANNKPSLCVDRILIAVFGETVLMTSTKSGKPSNRTLKNKNSDGKQKELKQLDQTKLQACQDFYNYWLKNVWVPPEEGDILEEMRLFDKYVSAKTAYYKKQGEKRDDIAPKPQKRPAKEKETKKKEKNDNDKIGSEAEKSVTPEEDGRVEVIEENGEGKEMHEEKKNKEKQSENSEDNHRLQEEEIDSEDEQKPSTSYNVKEKFAFVETRFDEDNSSDGSTLHISDMESASDPLSDGE